MGFRTQSQFMLPSRHGLLLHMVSIMVATQGDSYVDAPDWQDIF